MRLFLCRFRFGRLGFCRTPALDRAQPRHPAVKYRTVGRHSGAIAVAAWRPDAVETLSNGIMAVRYDRLGLQLKTLH